MQKRLNETKTCGSAPDDLPAVSEAISPSQIILGVDPSLRGTGYGIIRIGKNEPSAVAHGTIAVSYTHLTLPTNREV